MFLIKNVFSEVSDILDVESATKNLLFDEPSVRKNFIRKVYLLLAAQLLLTFALLANFAFNKALRDIVLRYPSLFWVAFFLIMMTMLVMVFCEDARRQIPFNYLFLLAYTLAQSFMLGTIICNYNALEILLAVGITAVICFSLSIYAMQTKFDFTVMGSGLLVVMVVFLIVGLFTTTFRMSPVMSLYSGVGAILFTIYLIYDTQLMVGGQHKYSLSPEEYTFAALNIYIDVINVFLYILSLVSSGRS